MRTCATNSLYERRCVFLDKLLGQLPIPLLEWYRENARVLPWRSDPTPYKVWLSEIMLQQTRVAAVIGYFNRLTERCPTVADLAALDEDSLMKLWQGLGYYSRARNLHRTAKLIAEEYGGVFPADYDAIRALPGIGDYTAGAICSIAFGIPVPAVDGNVLRVVSRITADETDIGSPALKKKVTSALEQIIPAKIPGTFNQAMMELGATVCLPNGTPLCERCPAAPFCEAHRTNRTALFPVKAPRKARRIEQLDVFLIFCDGKVALRRRPDTGLLAKLWEFPNEPSPATCPVSGQDGTTLSAKHIFTHVEWHMTARVIFTNENHLPPGWIWADRDELRHTYAIPNAFSSFAPFVDQTLLKTGGHRSWQNCISDTE